MSGKDLLAVLVMIVPSLLLIALIALTLVPPSVMAPPLGSGLSHDDGRKPADSKVRAAVASQAMQEAADRAARGLPPQKPPRDGLQKDGYATARNEPVR